MHAQKPLHLTLELSITTSTIYSNDNLYEVEISERTIANFRTFESFEYVIEKLAGFKPEKFDIRSVHAGWLPDGNAWVLADFTGSPSLSLVLEEIPARINLILPIKERQQ